MMADKASSRTAALTFRVRRIPAEITRSDLAEFLESSIDGGFGGVDNIRVRSLAKSPDDWNSTPKQTATLDFQVIPPLFNNASRTSWTVSGPKLQGYLLFDTDFLGFTPLNSSNELHDYDCVAVSGLASHPFGSWRQRNSTGSHQFMWLRDQLSLDFPTLRVMLYGYDTALAGNQSSQDIDDLARSFVAHLKAIGSAEISAPPIIILAHSLGGVLVKRALFYLANSGDAEDYMLSKVRLAVFFGVPNSGMKNKHLRTMVKGQPNDILVQSISIENPYLRFLDDALYGTAVFRTLRLVSIYETQPSVTAELQSDGKWARTGPLELLVSRSSAISKGSKDPHDIFHIDRDHSDLVKFSPDDLNYFTIRSVVLKTLQSTSQAVNRPERQPTVDPIKTPGSTQRMGPRDNTSIRMRTGSLDTNQYLNQSGGLSDRQEGLEIDLPRKSQDSLKEGRSEVRNTMTMRESLAYSEADYRYNAIDKAQKATFDWVFEKEVSFMDWVRSGNKIYWIRGKPGSGKSTLMKFLRNHQDFRTAITEIGFNVPQIDLWYFFNERGTYLQKTLDGLLRTIIRSLVDKSSLFASLVEDVYYSKSKAHRDRWSVDMLNEAFSAIVCQKQSDFRLLIFLDALDEYQGFPEIICDWIQRLVDVSEAGDGRTKIRICFSSRPWDSFLQAFDNSPGFELHVHTMQDMRYYARQRLADTIIKHPQTDLGIFISESPSSIEQIVDTIVQCAEGVFLWTAFALDEITVTFDTQDLDTLLSVINRLPAHLEDFYWRTIMRISEGRRWQAYTMLELVLRSPALVSAHDLFFASSCASGGTYAECVQLLERAKIRNWSELELSRKLLNLCNGLLEFVEYPQDNNAKSISKEGEQGRYYIQFVHRTVKDFVGSPGFQQIFLGREQATMSMNGYTFWFKYKIIRTRPEELDYSYFWFAHMDEKSNGRPLDTFLDSVPAALFKVVGALHNIEPFEFSSFVFGVSADLRLYVRKTIDIARQSAQLTALRARNPQHIIVRLAMEKWTWFDRMNLGYSNLNLSTMSAMLLENGFDVHGEVDGSNPFELLFRNPFMSFLGSGNTRALFEILSLARTFIKQGGQDPNSLIYNAAPTSQRYHLFKAQSSTSLRFSALHFVNHEAVTLLLECGADPNVLDTRGNTPLDVRVDLKGDVRKPEELEWRNLECDTIKLLLDHGALLTVRGKKILPDFLKIMQGCDSHEYLVRKSSELPLLETDAATEYTHQPFSTKEFKAKFKTFLNKRRGE